MIMEAIALVGTTLCTVCSIPQTVQSIKDGNSDGLSSAGLLMKGIGCILMIVYLISLSTSVFVYANFAFGLLVAGIQYYYKIHPRNKTHGIK
jgi:uncharacterized protein with PQ loop repeat